MAASSAEGARRSAALRCPVAWSSLPAVRTRVAAGIATAASAARALRCRVAAGKRLAARATTWAPAAERLPKELIAAPSARLATRCTALSGMSVVAIGLVYLLLLPPVIFFLLLLAVTGCFVSLAVTGRALDLPALISLLMLRGIVVTNAVVLLTLVQHKIETGDDVRTVLVQGGRTHVRPIPMTAAATILALIPLAPSSDDGLIAASLATVVIGGLLSSTLLTLVVILVIYSLSPYRWTADRPTRVVTARLLYVTWCMRSALTCYMPPGRCAAPRLGATLVGAIVGRSTRASSAAARSRSAGAGRW
jgi:hypothetical protein